MRVIQIAAVGIALLLSAPVCRAQPNATPTFRQIPGEVFVLPFAPELSPLIVHELEATGLFKARFVGRRSGGILFRVERGHEELACIIAKCHRFIRSANLHWGGEPGFTPFVGTPNDVHVADQWYLGPQATPTGIPARSNCTSAATSFHPASAGVPTAHANVVEAWRYSQGDPTITVAVFDSGIQYDHPEFAGRFFFPDLNYICGTQPPPNDCNPGPATDNNGHGTAVAGVLAANANNGAVGTVAPAPVPPLPGGPLNDFGGTAGIDPNCKILSVRLSVDFAHFGPQNPYGFAYTLLALEEVLANPVYASVRVINMSYGLPCADFTVCGGAFGPCVTEEEEEALHNVIRDLRTRTVGPSQEPSPVWVVTISGNSGGEQEANSRCPNRWPEVITVGAFDYLGRRLMMNRDCPLTLCNDANCPFADGKCCNGPASGRGEALDILAPGWGLKTALCYDSGAGCWVCGTQVQAWCQFNVGTSGAAPMVAGTISLMLARAKQLGVEDYMTWQTVYDILTANARDQEGVPAEDTVGWDSSHGWGNLDVGAAVANVEVFYNCRADLTATDNPAEWQFGIKDGLVNGEDVDYYDAQFALGNISVCDFTTGSVTTPGQPGYGVRDGVLDPIADRVVFMQFWNASTPGCVP
ncbi:MAG: S8/S53 family peptidase [Phycisphaerales bacterium]|nr:S8/S53 family peptidase [Phycisphaerales bacterium]